MKEEYLAAVQQAEQDILSRAQQLFALVEQGATFEQVVEGYQEVVTCIAEKYAIYMQDNEERSVEAHLRDERQSEIQQQYTQDLASLAVVIDRMRGIDIA